MNIFLKILKIILVIATIIFVVLTSFYFYLQSDYLYKNKFEEITNIDFPASGDISEKSIHFLFPPRFVKFVASFSEEDFKYLENTVKNNNDFLIIDREVRCYKGLKTIFIANYKNEENKTFKTISFCEDHKTVFVSGGSYR